jgi:hypothetical protein
LLSKLPYATKYFDYSCKFYSFGVSLGLVWVHFASRISVLLEVATVNNTQAGPTLAVSIA